MRTTPGPADRGLRQATLTRQGSRLTSDESLAAFAESLHDERERSAVLASPLRPRGGRVMKTRGAVLPTTSERAPEVATEGGAREKDEEQEEEEEEEEVVVKLARSARTIDVVATALLFLLYAWLHHVAMDNSGPGCTTNPEFSGDGCRKCGRHKSLVGWVTYETGAFGNNWVYGLVVCELLARGGQRGPALVFGVAATLVDGAVGFVAENDWKLEPDAGFVLTRLLFMFVLYAFIRLLAPVPALRRRTRGLLVYAAFQVLSSAVATSMMAALVRDGSDSVASAALVSIPVLLTLLEGLSIIVLRRWTETWPAMDLASMARMQIAAYEGIRVGALLIAADRDLGTFVLGLAVSVPLEIMSRNDLWWTGLRKAVLGWSDERVQRGFSQTKEMFLSSRLDSEYAPTLVLVGAQLFHSITTQVVVDCDGELLSPFRPGWAYIAAIFFAEVVTDLLTVMVRRLIVHWRPLLARNLAVSVPTSRAYTIAITWACFYMATLGLTGASIVAIGSEQG